MERTAVDPWPWSVKLGFDQAELVEGHRRARLQRFATTLLGVARLVTPDLLVALEATAMD